MRLSRRGILKTRGVPKEEENSLRVWIKRLRNALYHVMSGDSQRNPDATVFVGNLDERIDDDILWELLNQCGPVNQVYIPKDKVSGKHQGYGFVEFRGEDDAEYAMKIMNMVKVFDKPIKVNAVNHEKRKRDVGANLFIGNLSPEVDEKVLFDTFSAFGGILGPPKIMRDAETTESKGAGFVSFETFAQSDLALECMNGQFLCGNVITVKYAMKKDGGKEKHGSAAERALAAHMQPAKFIPHTMFSAGAGDASIIQAPNPAPGPSYYQQTAGMHVPPIPLSHQGFSEHYAAGLVAPPPPPPPA